MGFFQQQAPSLSFGVFFEGLNSLAALLPAEVPVSQLGATVFACPRNCTHKKSPFYFILRQLLALQVVYFDSHCSVGHLAAKPGDTKGWMIFLLHVLWFLGWWWWKNDIFPIIIFFIWFCNFWQFSFWAPAFVQYLFCKLLPIYCNVPKETSESVHLWI